MIDIHGTEICISRGDTASISFCLSGNVPSDGTIAIVTLKKHVGAENKLWEKRLTVSGGQVALTLGSADTDLAPGDYTYDLRLVSADEVITPLPPQLFRVIGVVGDGR